MPCWWDKKYGKDKICSITNTRLRAGKSPDNTPYSVFLPCKHGFNRKALENWVKVKGDETTCPMCRGKFNWQKLNQK
jgi:hypothetical protein